MLLHMLIAAVALAQPAPTYFLEYTEPAMTWDEGFPLGNGILGALVWGDGDPLNISLDRTDLWDLRPVPEFHGEEYTWETMQAWEKEGRYDDLKRVYEEPYHRPGPTKIPAGRITLNIPGAPFELAGLSPGDAIADIHFANDGHVRVWIAATEPVGVITVSKIPGVTPKLVVPAFGGKEPGEAKPAIVAGELAELGYDPPEIFSGDSFCGYTQHGYGDFAFSVFLAWTRWKEEQFVAAWSIASTFEGPDTLEIAKERATRALDEEHTVQLFSNHTNWWDTFWNISVHVPNEIIRRQWVLDTYKFASATRADTPPITLQGPWTADDGKLPPWKGDYHHDLNTELSYWPAYSGNRLEAARGYVDWLWDTRDNCVEWTKRFYDIPGLNVPMTADLFNRQIGGWRQYTHSATTGAWLAHHFYLHWKYTGDREFLETRAYPYLHEVAVFLEAVTAKRDADGHRSLPLSSSPEINDNKPNAWFDSMTNYDNALIRWAFTAAAELAHELGKEDDATRWEKGLGEMPPLAMDDHGALLVAKGHPLEASHRHFSHLMAFHPFGLIDVSQGESARKTIDATMADLDRLGTDYWCGYSFAWLASLAARARDGEKAEQALETFAKAFVLRNSFHCNGDQTGDGYSKFTYRPFTLEGNFAAAAGLQEMLLQSHTGVIDIFPAVPESWRDISFTRLRAQGGYLVSASKTSGLMEKLEITATQDGACQLRVPGKKEIQTINLTKGQTWTWPASMTDSVRNVPGDSGNSNRPIALGTS